MASGLNIANQHTPCHMNLHIQMQEPLVFIEIFTCPKDSLVSARHWAVIQEHPSIASHNAGSREGKKVQVVCLYFRNSKMQYICGNDNILILLLTLKHIKWHLLACSIFKLAHSFTPVLCKFWKTVKILSTRKKLMLCQYLENVN